MAGRTARRSRLESVGVVVEMYKNLTDKAGVSCPIGQIALLPSVNTYYFFHQAFFIISTSNFILIKRNLFLRLRIHINLILHIQPAY